MPFDDFAVDNSASVPLYTPHSLLTLDIFWYTFWRNPRRHANILSFRVFEEYPWLITRDEILQKRSLLISLQQIGKNVEAFGFFAYSITWRIWLWFSTRKKYQFFQRKEGAKKAAIIINMQWNDYKYATQYSLYKRSSETLNCRL